MRNLYAEVKFKDARKGINIATISQMVSEKNKDRNYFELEGRTREINIKVDMCWNKKENLLNC
jgi:hypothetical protein